MGAVQVPAALYADHHFVHGQGSLPGDRVAAWLARLAGTDHAVRGRAAPAAAVPGRPPADASLAARRLARRHRPDRHDARAHAHGRRHRREAVARPQPVRRAAGGRLRRLQRLGRGRRRAGPGRARGALPAQPRRRAAAAQVARLRRGGDGGASSSARLPSAPFSTRSCRRLLGERHRRRSSPCRSSRASRSSATGSTRSTSSSTARCSTARSPRASSGPMPP